MMKNRTYTQTNFESCLPVCLLLLTNKKFSKLGELNLTIAGIKASRTSYAIGMLDIFTKKYKLYIDVYVDNKYFLKVLNKELLRLNNRYINLAHKTINKKTIMLEPTPYILYVDHHDLGVYSHVPHFIIVSKKSGNNFIIFDPWTGKRKKVNLKLINKSVVSLKNHIKYCPLLIKIVA